MIWQQEMKRQRNYDLLNAETNPKFLCLPYTIYIGKYFFFLFFTENELFKKKGEWNIEKRTKKRLCNCFRYGD